MNKKDIIKELKAIQMITKPVCKPNQDVNDCSCCRLVNLIADIEQSMKPKGEVCSMFGL